MSKTRTNRFTKLQCVLLLTTTFGAAVMPTASFALGTEAERAACTPDVFRLCSSEIPNISRIIACMKAKKSSLSPACRLVFDKGTPTQAAQANQ